MKLMATVKHVAEGVAHRAEVVGRRNYSAEMERREDLARVNQAAQMQDLRNLEWDMREQWEPDHSAMNASQMQMMVRQYGPEYVRDVYDSLGDFEQTDFTFGDTVNVPEPEGALGSAENPWWRGHPSHRGHHG